SGDGEVVLNGASAQSISGGGSFENLRLDNSTSVDFTDPADLFGVVYVDQGTLNTNGNLSLRCNFGTPGKTAQVGPVGGTIVGDVTVEQCFPARRAFRLLTSSVTTTGSIRQNWQENPSSYTNDPNPG
ncbi:peptidase M14, partial [Aquimarina celericrescens]|nr:peptidase M14 [Aquimarina celericrescens]